MKHDPKPKAVAADVGSAVAELDAAGLAVAAVDMAATGTVVDMAVAADTAAVVDVRGANRVIRLFQALDAPITTQGRL
jgi:hypothetical protein